MRNALLVVLCCLPVVLGQLPVFTHEPASMLKGAPFRVTTVSSTVSSVFVSRTGDCNSVATGGSTVPLVGGRATFTVTTNPETTFFLCDAASNIPLRALVLNPVTYEPQFLFRATASTLTFAPVTPAYSRVQLRSYGDCTTGTAAYDGTLSATNKSVTVTMESSVYYFVCIQFSSTVTGQSVTINAGSVLVTEAVHFTPESGVRGDTAIFELSGAAPPFTQAVVSTTSNCKTPVVGPLAATGTFGKTVATTLSMARGVYEFCIETPMNSGMYVSAGKLQVLEYGFTPNTLFQGRTTTLRLTMDSPINTDIVLTQNVDCSPPFIAGPTVPSPPSGSFVWTLGFAIGTYTTCVRKKLGSTDYVAAGSLSLVMPYTVTIGSIPSIVGVVNALSVSPNPITRVVMSANSDCSNPMVDVTTATSQAQFVVTSATPDLVSICVYTIDGTGVYAVGLLPLKTFSLTHSPVLVDRPTTFALDLAAPVNSPFRFATAPSCSGASSLVDMIVPPGKIITSAVNTSGITYACLQGLGVYRPVASFQTHPSPAMYPADALSHITTASVLTRSTGNAEWRVGANCSHVLASTTTGFVGNTTLDVTYPAAGVYRGCIGLTDSAGSIEFLDIGTTTSSTVSHSPFTYVDSKPSTLRIEGIPTSLFASMAGSIVFVVPSTQDCPATAAGAYPTFLVTKDPLNTYFSVNTFMQNISGSYKVCLTVEAQVLMTGTIQVITPLNTTFSAPNLFVNVPFSFGITLPYIPNQYAIVAALDQCSGPGIVTIAQGNFRLPGGSSEPISISTVGRYALCISSQDGTTMLWNDLITVTRFQPLSLSLIRTIPNVIRTTPELPLFSLYLSPTVGCAAPTYGTDADNVLTAPEGRYFVCGTQGTGWTSSGDPMVEVYPPFVSSDAAALVGVRVNVSFNVTIQGGDIYRTPHTNLCMASTEECNCRAEGNPVFQTTKNSSDFSQRRFGMVQVSTPRFVQQHLCALTFDETGSMSLGTVTPLPYMSPYSIAKGSFQWVVSGDLWSGYATVMRTASCEFPLTVAVPIVNYNASNIFVSNDITVEEGYFCESFTATGPWTNRGVLTLLNNFFSNASTPTPVPGMVPAPPDNNTGINITGMIITVSPATPFNLTVPPSVGSNPFVSSTSDCNHPLPTVSTYGIFPTEGGQNKFFVCILSPDGSTVYTNPEPTLTVVPFETNIKSLEVGEPTVLTIAPSASLNDATDNNFILSYNADCSTQEAGPFSLNGPITVPSTAQGLVYVCVEVVNRLHGILTLAVFKAPQVLNTTVALRGYPVCSVVELSDPNYNLLGTDESYPLSSYFRQLNRTTYLSSDLDTCLSSDSVGVEATLLSSDSAKSFWRVCHDSDLITDVTKPYAVCMGTPVRNAPATSRPVGRRMTYGENIVFVVANVTPMLHVTGVPSPIGIPELPGGTFHLSASAALCNTRVSPDFTTNGLGDGYLSSHDYATSTTGTPVYLAPGNYALCALHEENMWYPVATVTLFAPQHYAVSNTVAVAGVVTSIELLLDLRSDAVYGLAMGTASCAVAQNTSAGALLTRTSATSISVRGQQDYTTATLCARAAVNNSLIAVATISFIPNPIQYPASVAACVQFTLGFSYIEDAKAGTSLFLYRDSCCHATRDPLRMVATAQLIPTQQTLRTMEVTRLVMQTVEPQTSFNLCLTNTTTCLDIGIISMSDTRQCQFTLIPGTPRPLSQARFVGGAPPPPDDEDVVDMIWILILFVVVFVVILIVVVIYAKTRSSKVVPEDADVPEEEDGATNPEAVTWKRSFDLMFMGGADDGKKGPGGSRKKDSRSVQSILHVPIDMTLNVCLEVPLELQTCQAEEAAERRLIEDDVDFCFEQIMESHCLGLSSANEMSSVQQRTQLLRHVLSIHEREMAEVEAEEADDRYTVNIDEEQVRLTIAELERQSWRLRMQQDNQRIQEDNAANTTGPINFRSRNRRLKDGSSKMFQHLDAAAGPALRSPQRSHYHEDISVMTTTQTQSHSHNDPMYSPPRPTGSNQPSSTYGSAAAGGDSSFQSQSTQPPAQRPPQAAGGDQYRTPNHQQSHGEYEMETYSAQPQQPQQQHNDQLFSPIEESNGRYSSALREMNELRTTADRSAAGSRGADSAGGFSFTDGATPSRRSKRSAYVE